MSFHRCPGLGGPAKVQVFLWNKGRTVFPLRKISSGQKSLPVFFRHEQAELGFAEPAVPPCGNEAVESIAQKGGH